MTSNTVLITGITAFESREILFQSAVYWAEQGSKVLYITQSKFESLPSTGHGPPVPLPEILSKIRIVYLQNEETLMEYVTDILTLRDTVPRVILIEALDEFTTEEESRDRDHSLARLCAVLCHVTSICASHLEVTVHLLVAVATDRVPPVVCSMFDSLWTFYSDSNRLTRILPKESSRVLTLTLNLRSDGAYVLREISQLFCSKIS